MNSKRQHILDTAARLFGERGYELVGINEIIAEADVAKATFYANFKSKENLCVEWLSEVAAKLEQQNRALLKEPLTAREKMGRVFESLAMCAEGGVFRGCPFSATASVVVSPDSPIRAVIKDQKIAFRSFCHSVALEAVRDPADARELGDHCFLLYSGALTEAQNLASRWPLDAAKATVDALFQALAKKP